MAESATTGPAAALGINPRSVPDGPADRPRDHLYLQPEPMQVGGATGGGPAGGAATGGGATGGAAGGAAGGGAPPPPPPRLRFGFGFGFASTGRRPTDRTVPTLTGWAGCAGCEETAGTSGPE